MSPPFIPPGGVKNEKPQAAPAVYTVRGWLCGYLGKDCLKADNVEFSYLLYLIFSCLMICGSSTAT
jgi:hypothetical protein